MDLSSTVRLQADFPHAIAPLTTVSCSGRHLVPVEDARRRHVVLHAGASPHGRAVEPREVAAWSALAAQGLHRRLAEDRAGSAHHHHHAVCGHQEHADQADCPQGA